MNVVYLKIFDDGSVYVGATKDFKRRMSEHERKSKNSTKKQKVQKHMRNFNHKTEIVFYSDDYNETLSKEKEFIELKD